LARNYRIIVSGRVQGVCFRATTKELADQLGLSGAVKNLSDGTVEIVLEHRGDELFKKLKQEFDISIIDISPCKNSVAPGFTIK